MVTKLTDYIKTYDDVFPRDECERIIKTFEIEDHNQVVLDRNKRPTFTEMNISQQYLKRNMHWTDIQKQVQNVFVEYVTKYIDELDLRNIDFPEKYVFEEFRVKRYLPNGKDEFADHVDVGDHSSARRFLVGFLYLNDVEAGGTTDFPKIKHSVTPKCGRILFFPPTWQYRHAGRPVTEGKKYILGTYLHYL